MKKVISFCAVLFFAASLAHAEGVQFGTWQVIQASDSRDYIAVTGIDDYSKMLGYRCYADSQECAHILVADITCENEADTPLLINSDHSALAMNAICVDAGDSHELLLTDFENTHTILLEANVVGFAIPMESGQFKVIRFSLQGSRKAMEYVEKKIQDSAEYY